MNWLVWLCSGILCAIFELFTPGFFFLGIGVSLALVAIPASLSAPLWFQLLVFAICTALFFLFIKPLVEKIPSSTKKSGTDALIGESGIVTESITKADGGRVKIHGESWKAESLENIEKDEEVVVIAIEGVTLKVRRK